MATKQEIFEQTLSKSYEQGSFVDFIREMISGVRIIAPEKELITYNTYAVFVSKYFHIGEYVDPEGDSIGIFAIELKRGESVERARSAQRSFVKTLLEKGGYAGALVAFYSVSAAGKRLDTWRFSFIRMDFEFTKGKIKETLTPAKRYSYLVGKGEPCHTAMTRLFPIFIDDDKAPTLDELEEAFSVETVTKEFFEQYKEKYLQMKEYLESNEDFVNESAIRGFTSEQFTKKLLAQIVFLYFIQKKGWLGVTAIPPVMMERDYKKAFFAKGARSREMIEKLYHKDSSGLYSIDVAQLEALSDEDEEFLSTIVKGLPWGTGPKDFMRKIFEGCSRRGLNFFDDYLEPLFYTALNKNRGENAFFPPLHRRVPFLNGGLFEELDHYDWENNDFQIPNELFSNRDTKGRDADGVLDIFDRYNFTMAEDEPMEREVAVDPEMLGKVFENLLEVKDRKSKGAFYTPREIVHYMCQESLINYLVTKTGIAEDDIRKLVLYGEYFKEKDAEKTKRVPNKDGKSFHMELDKEKEFEIPASIFSYRDGTNRLMEIDQHLANVKVVDPAVGSGAFPLGMLNEIVKVRDTLSTYISLEMNAFEKKSLFAPGFVGSRNVYELKAETIKNCIFACDIEPSATDIAKLRLWLSLVIDDELTTDALDSGIFGEHSKPRQLPNLDCNIICGNSLDDTFGGIELIKESDVINNIMEGHQENLVQSGVDNMIASLIDLQDKLFYTKETSEKDEIKRQIQGIYDAIIEEQLQINPELLNEYEDCKDNSSKPFVLWQLYYPKVFRDNGGFDICIGNPPYKLCQPSNTEEEVLDYYKTHFKVASYKIDLFHLFFEKGISLLRQKGILSYITPNTYLTNKYIKPLRKLLLEECTIKVIVNHDKVFTSASVDTATIVMTKEPCENSLVLVLQSAHYNFIEVCRKEQRKWIDDKDYVFNINKETIEVAEDCVNLGSICKTYFGIQAYDRKSSISERKVDENHLPMIDGGDIHAYSYSIPKLYFNYLPELIKSGGDWKVYSKDRIVVRQIGQVPIVGFCEKGILGSNTLYSIFPKDNTYDLKYLLACLNSTFIQNYWRAKYSDNKATFPKIKGFQLKELPIPTAPHEIQLTIAKMVEEVLTRKSESEKSDEIEKRIDELVNKLYVEGKTAY